MTVNFHEVSVEPVPISLNPEDMPEPEMPEMTVNFHEVSVEPVPISLNPEDMPEPEMPEMSQLP